MYSLCFGFVGYSSMEKSCARASEKEKQRVREGREARRYNMIQTVSTADCIQLFHWCMETCAGHVCVRLSGHCTIRKIQREKQPGRHWQTHLHLWEPTGPRVASVSVCSGSPGVLDPLVSALSDLQVVLSHLIMLQPPWIFKEWLSDTCQTSLTRLMESTVVSVRQMIGRDSPVALLTNCILFIYVDVGWPLKGFFFFLVRHVVLVNRM